MNIATHIKTSLELPDSIVRSYTQDLTDADLLVRPLETMNHLAWQWGHLIASENVHINLVVPDSMPALPDGFAERHSPKAAARDTPEDFLTKQAYLDLMQQQRNGTLAILESLTDEQLLSPSPESINYFGPTIGSVFAGEASHWMMHAGQWAVIRRRLGKPPLF